MDYTMLINKHHKITEDEIGKINLVSCYDCFKKEVLIEEKTLFHFNELKKFLEEEKNIIIGIDSGFRSIKRQEELIEEFTMKYGYNYTQKHVALPGSSEHHTGLCVDFLIQKDNYFPTNNREIMDNIKIYEEVKQYLSDFGFILRFPNGKEKITGFNYEPWHIRYVGKDIAKYIDNKNITLEEYYIKKNSGVLLVNKEIDMTSRDVVNIVSKKLGIKKVGHTGTLDPLATGLLVITVGDATKIGELLVSKDKEYIAEFKLGMQTDTLDITGKVLKEKEVRENIDIKSALKHFNTTYMQEVPIYSAVKVNGKKLYEYARENIEIELPKKEVTIKELELLEEKDNIYKIRCVVSKGTYIRSLIRDIGEYLDTYATMTSLQRIKQSGFSLEDAYTLEDIKKENLKIIPIADALNLKKITISGDKLKKVKNGVRLNNLNEKTKVMFVDENDEVIAIYEENGRPWKVFS